MSARDDILGRIGAALDQAGGGAARRRAGAELRLAHPPRHPVPARAAGKTKSELIALLKRHLESQGAIIVEAGDFADVPEAVSGFLGDGASVRMGSDRVLAELGWGKAPGLAIRHGAAQTGDKAGLSRAVGGIAETGTLLLLSGPDNPVTVTFLPETHIVVLDTGDLAGTYEEAIVRLRGLCGDNGLPRTVNLVSGPSRTADIGGILVMGAHGPKRLAVVLVGAKD